MDLDERFEQIAVIGAAGKMGRGISLLLAWEMARLKNRPQNRGKTYRLNLTDTRQDGLQDLLGYIESQSARRVKSKFDAVRSIYPESKDVRKDEQIARVFVADTLSVVRTHTDCRQARHSRVVFEAVPEVPSLKVDTLRQLAQTCSKDAFFLSNTSSIPIEFLDREAGLDGRVIGFHFHNPPAVQKLVELVAARTTRPGLVETARKIARRLGKTLVHSRDIAGFISNGYFVRDGLYALREAERLCSCFGRPGAIYALNRVSREGLLRPMGIFQLIDYVGLGVFSSILKVMAGHNGGENFSADLIDTMLSKNLPGGQRPDGSQKDGFFRYDKRRPVGVYAPDREDYIPLRSGAMDRVDRALGTLAAAGIAWKNLLDDPDRGRKLKDHFTYLAALDTLGARLTAAYLSASRTIGEKLVSDGVAESPDDVNAVLLDGFHHLYGPFNDYVAPRQALIIEGR